MYYFLKGIVKVCKQWVVLVFLAENHELGRYLPVDVQRRVGEQNTAICLWVVEIVALIGEDRALAQYRKSMGKAARDIELTMALGIQFHSKMLTVGRTIFAQVHRHIQHTTFRAADQLGLSIRWTLEMQTTHYTIGGTRLIVLYESASTPASR